MALATLAADFDPNRGGGKLLSPSPAKTKAARRHAKRSSTDHPPIRKEPRVTSGEQELIHCSSERRANTRSEVTRNALRLKTSDPWAGLDRISSFGGIAVSKERALKTGLLSTTKPCSNPRNISNRDLILPGSRDSATLFHFVMMGSKSRSYSSDFRVFPANPSSNSSY